MIDLGFEIVATKGTAKVLANNGIPVQTVFKVGEGRPDIVDRIKNGEIALVINTRAAKNPRRMKWPYERNPWPTTFFASPRSSVPRL